MEAYLLTQCYNRHSSHTTKKNQLQNTVENVQHGASFSASSVHKRHFMLQFYPSKAASISSWGLNTDCFLKKMHCIAADESGSKCDVVSEIKAY